jgi:hypothetical protein
MGVAAMATAAKGEKLLTVLVGALATLAVLTPDEANAT